MTILRESGVQPTLVFDLDGTLVDSVPDLRRCLNRLMASRGLAAFSYAEVALMVGDGVRVLLTRAFAARDGALDEPALAAFMADYEANAAVDSALFPGIEAALAALAADGWRLAVCTNKPVVAARLLLTALGIAGYFAAVGGGDSFAVRKPDPAHLRATIEAAGGDPRQAVMTGDHANDVAAAAGLGVPCVFAGWGYGPPAMAQGAAAVAASAAELPALARALLAGGQGRLASLPGRP
jgi:phosphoglycolate phosphatase